MATLRLGVCSSILLYPKSSQVRNGGHTMRGAYAEFPTAACLVGMLQRARTTTEQEDKTFEKSNCPQSSVVGIPGLQIFLTRRSNWLWFFFPLAPQTRKPKKPKRSFPHPALRIPMYQRIRVVKPFTGTHLGSPPALGSLGPQHTAGRL